MARMIGAWSRPWCPHCRGPAGPDCPDRSRSKKAQRQAEKREWSTEARRWTAPGSRTGEG